MKEDTDRMNNQIFKEVERYQQQMKWDSNIGLGVADVCEEVPIPGLHNGLVVFNLFVLASHLRL